MAKRSLVNEAVYVEGLASVTVGPTDTTKNAATFDRLNTANPVHDVIAIVDVGAWSTDGTATVHLEESDNDSDWTDVAAADVVVGGATAAAPPSGTVGSDWIINGAADDDAAAIFGYLGDKRYIRVAIDLAGQTTGALAAVQVHYVGANPRNMIDRVANASA